MNAGKYVTVKGVFVPAVAYRRAAAPPPQSYRVAALLARKATNLQALKR